MLCKHLREKDIYVPLCTLYFFGGAAGRMCYTLKSVNSYILTVNRRHIYGVGLNVKRKSQFFLILLCLDFPTTSKLL